MPIEYIAIGEKIISNLSLELSLKEIHERITNIYHDICSAYIQSAEQALNAISFSQSPINELHSILDNLRNACNLLTTLLYQKRNFLFFEVNVLSKDEQDDVKQKLSSLYVAQAIVYCLTTNKDYDGVNQLLHIASSFYKEHIIYRANIRNKEGYDELGDVEYIDDGEWGGYYNLTCKHHDYTSEEKLNYLNSELEKVKDFNETNLQIIRRINSM